MPEILSTKSLPPLESGSIVQVSPPSLTIKVGESATITLDPAIVAWGQERNLPVTEPTFQWYKNGQKIAGANSSSYTIPPATLSDNNSKYLCFINGKVIYFPALTLVWLYVYSEGEKLYDWQYLGAAPFPPGDSIKPQIKDGKGYFYELWKGGGVGNMISDVYEASTATNWTKVFNNGPWGDYDMHSTFILNGEHHVIAGANAAGPTNRHFKSSDNGRSWVKLPDAPWAARAAGAAYVLKISGKEKAFFAGGEIGRVKGFNDIWSYQDSAWKLELLNAAWSPRWDQCAAVKDNKVYLIAGLGTALFNDVWVSDDGVNFKLATGNGGFKPRHWFCSTVYRNNIFIQAGEGYYGDQFSDVWYSGDGVTWKQLKSKVFPRHMHGNGILVIQDELVVFGGSDFYFGVPQTTNGIWTLKLPADFGGSTPIDPDPVIKYLLTTNAKKSPDKPLYDAGENVTLTPNANFKDWSIGGSNNPLVVTMDANKTINANYIDPPPVPTGDLTSRMQIVLGPLPPTGHDLKIDIIFNKDMGSYILREIAYLSDPGDGMKTRAYLTIPKKAGKKIGMVIPHQTTPLPISNGGREPVNYYDAEYLQQIKEKYNNDSRYPFIDPDMFFGVELAEQGVVTICPDAAFFGKFWQSQGGEPAPYCYDAGYKSATMKNVQIHRQALRVLESMAADVDANKIGIMGHSLGGYNAWFAAYYEQKFKVIILSPFSNIKAYIKAAGSLHGPDPGVGYTGYRYMPLLRPYKPDGSNIPFDFEELLYSFSNRKVFLNIPTKDYNSDVNVIKPYINTAISKFPAGNIEVVYPEIHHTFARPERYKAYAFIQKHFGGVITPPIDPIDPPDDPPIDPPVPGAQPEAPTNPVVDNDKKTFGFTPNPNYPNLSDYVYKPPGVPASSRVTSNPITGLNMDIPIGQLEVYLSPTPTRKGGKSLRNDKPFTKAVTPPIDPPVKTFTLNVFAQNGKVIKTPDAGPYIKNEIVLLDARPNLGYEFDNWTGSVSGISENTLAVIMDSDKNITANFKKITVIEPPVDPPIPSGPVQIPLLNWQPGRSDWFNVDAKVTKSNDTEYMKGIIAGIKTGDQIHLPEGIIRISETLNCTTAKKYTGVSIIGHGRGTTILWEGGTFSGAELAMIYFESALSHSKIVGITFDGNNKAGTGVRHTLTAYETELLYRHCHFKNFAGSAGLKFYAHKQRATSEPTVDNCLFEDCATGLAISEWNNLDNVIMNCEFRNCGFGVRSMLGTNFYMHNTHFEGSTKADIVFAGAHGASIRRVTSNGSAKFIDTDGSLIAVPLTVQDCKIANFKEGITAKNMPLTLIDVEFTKPVSKATIPVNITGSQKIIRSNLTAPDSDKVINVQAIEIPGKGGTLKSASQSFLQSEVRIPGKVFEPKAKTVAAINEAKELAKAHGKDAICYLPFGKWNINETIVLDGKDYFFGGSGHDTMLKWIGPDGGTTLKNVDNVPVSDIAVGIVETNKTANKYDILHVGGKVGRCVYDRVWVYGMYSREPAIRGIHFQNLVKGEEILLNGIEGNITFTDSSEGTVLIPVSWEGAITVEGKSLNRSGFIGAIGRLGSVVEPGLLIKDNNSFVISDFYSESGWGIIWAGGNNELPAGRITASMAKFELRRLHEDGTPLFGNPVVINNYKGELNLGPVLFWSDQKEHNFKQTGDAPFSLNIWGAVFSNSNPKFFLETAKHSMIGTNKPDIDAPQGLLMVAKAMDHLRELMTVTDKFSKSTVIEPPIDPPPVPVIPVADDQTVEVVMTGTGKTNEIVSQSYTPGKVIIKFINKDKGKESLPATITINVK